jgi:maleylpyruvate isomerase
VGRRAGTPEPGGDAASGADALRVSTERLLATAERLDASLLVGPSLCPGWSRAHVLGHLARNADALTRLCTWAATGTPTPMYASPGERATEIDSSSRQPAAELLEDLARSAERFAGALTDLSDDALTRRVRLGPGGTGAEIPASRIGWQRRKEVEIHHVDLDRGYSPADWPPDFVERALAQTLRMLRRRDETPAVVVHVTGAEPVTLGATGGPTVTGSAAVVLAWLTGRSSGAGLSVNPPGNLPVMPAWA